MRHLSHRPFTRRSAGMSLIEIMVGLAIALVVTLVIFQVFQASSSINRTTASGNEAQISGNIGLFQLERDLKAAGLGFGTLANAGGGCGVLAINPLLATPNFTFPLVPILITVGASAVPDKIDVLYGNSAYMTAGRRFSTGTGSTKTTVSRGGFQLGDLVLATDLLTPPVDCELIEVTDNTAADTLTFTHAQGANYTNFYTGAATAATHNSAGTAATMNGGGLLYNLGSQPALNHWQLTNNSLTFTNLLATGVESTVAEGVVHLKAQYGVDDGAGGVGGAVAGDGIISPSEWTTATPANWTQVLAVRFALLTRSQAMEKTAVTTVAPTWAGGSFDMTGLPSWQNYRYRVFESVVALRNVIWGVSQ